MELVKRRAGPGAESMEVTAVQSTCERLLALPKDTPESVAEPDSQVQ